MTYDFDWELRRALRMTFDQLRRQAAPVPATSDQFVEQIATSTAMRHLADDVERELRQ